MPSRWRALPAWILLLLSLPAPAAAQFASDRDRRDALRLYRAGQELMSAEQFEKAADAFQQSIDKDPLLTASHYGLGQAFMALQRYASAIRAFRECREAHLTLHGLSERGRVEIERQREEELRELRDTIRRLAQMPNTQLRIRRIEARIQELERQRTSNTGGFVPPPELSLALGSAHFRNGQLDDAEREWKAAVAANARFGEAFNNLAALYAMTGRAAEAASAVRDAERVGFRVNPQLKEDIRNLPAK